MTQNEKTVETVVEQILADITNVDDERALREVLIDTLTQRDTERDKEIREAVRAEWKRCIDLLNHDHTKCPIPETCIGYQGAQSDLMNNPPNAIRRYGRMRKQEKKTANSSST